MSKVCWRHSILSYIHIYARNVYISITSKSAEKFYKFTQIIKRAHVRCWCLWEVKRLTITIQTHTHTHTLCMAKLCLCCMCRRYQRQFDFALILESLCSCVNILRTNFFFVLKFNFENRLTFCEGYQMPNPFFSNTEKLHKIIFMIYQTRCSYLTEFGVAVLRVESNKSTVHKFLHISLYRWDTLTLQNSGKLLLSHLYDIPIMLQRFG